MDVMPGEHTVILGPNGCGKSTLLKLMTCELYPLAKDETSVCVLGRARWDVTELRRRLGVVSAELPGKPMLETTGFDAVLTGFFSSATLWPNLVVTDAMRERAEELVGELRLSYLRDRLVGHMSAGQQRRAMIARAMAGASEGGTVRMLLLDEPSNALDIAAQAELRELMQAVAQQGTTIVLITHHVADILPEMRRVVMMREGRIVADGEREELLTSARMSELFGREVEVERRGGWWSLR